MFAFVAAAGDVRQGGLRVGGRRTSEDRARRIVARQSSCDAAHAPGATEIQAVEMHKLRISAVGDNSRFQQGFRLIARDARQKAMKPRGEFSSLHYASH